MVMVIVIVTIGASISLGELTVVPNYVNYHLEHHLRPNIPC